MIARTSSNPQAQFFSIVDVVATLPKEVTAAARALPYAPERYFSLPEKTQIIPVEQLRLARSRPDGILSAVKRMAEAATGMRDRRAPVRVTSIAPGIFGVLDGNSTTCIAAAAGWPDLPCLIE